MSQQKTHHFRPPLYHRQESAAGGSGQVRTPAASSASSRANDSDRQGWDAYRRWLGRTGEKAPAERAPLDPAIYSWKGYQNWADKVRQNWKSEDKQ